MVELIFIIVIIGLLAAIAIPKLSATRDDAFAAKATYDLSVKIQNAANQYTAHKNFDNLSSTIDCFKLLYNQSEVTVTVEETNEHTYCVKAHFIAHKNNLSVLHKFGGTEVLY